MSNMTPTLFVVVHGGCVTNIINHNLSEIPRVVVLDMDALHIGDPCFSVSRIDLAEDMDANVQREIADYLDDTPNPIKELAESLDCAILHRAGAIALQLRYYTKGGVQITRHQPDNGDFYTLEEWQSAIKDGSAAELTH
jgi:hypothetical protein